MTVAAPWASLPRAARTPELVPAHASTDAIAHTMARTLSISWHQGLVPKNMGVGCVQPAARAQSSFAVLTEVTFHTSTLAVDAGPVQVTLQVAYLYGTHRSTPWFVARAGSVKTPAAVVAVVLTVEVAASRTGKVTKAFACIVHSAEPMP